MSVDEVMDEFEVTREQVHAVLRIRTPKPCGAER
ncbi:MAG TPA: hypothetical protein VKM93_07375 [Terriglobia bacterium]|nr:hypothetical protein [Terriglobia bacterium]